jgi:hypothetical protein
MKRFSNTLVFRLAAGGLLWFGIIPAMQAMQDTSTQSVKTGQESVSTEIKSGEVVYVSGNDLVVRVADGQVKHITVPDDFKFQVDGKDLSVHELTPGMRLTRTITTTSVPKTVTTVRTVKGTVWQVTPPESVILTLADNTNKRYKVPKGQKFDVNGEQRDVFSLKKGMKISATVVTESPEVVQTTARTVTGEAPAPPPPAPETPPVVGVLLIEVPEDVPQPQQTAAAHPAELPQTASLLPLFGLLGALCVITALAFRVFGPKEAR